MSQSKTTSAIAAVIVGACLWGFIGYFSRNLSDAGFSSIQVAFTRMLIGLTVLLLGLLIFDRKCFRINRKDLWIFVFFSIFKILSDVFLFSAQVRIHLSLSTVLQLTSPYWALILCVFLFGERITTTKLFAICLAFFGCVLVTGILSSDVNFDSVGVVLALLSGISYATYTVGNKVLMNRGYSGNTILFYIFLICTVMCLPFSDIATIPGKVEGLDTVWDLMAMGVLMTLVPYYLQIYALKYITPLKAQVVGLLEVAAAVVVGYLMYDESLGWLNLVGMVLIPLSIIIMNANLFNRNTTETE